MDDHKAALRFEPEDVPHPVRSPGLDLAPPKPWRRFVPSWLRSLIWVDSARGYDTFLSYSWKSDSKVAPVIQSAIQRFLCPWYKLRGKTVFRDLSCLPAGSSLENELFDRLDRSTHLIVLASPEAAKSHGMEMEARHWFSRQRDGQVLVIVAAGEGQAWEEIRKYLLPASVSTNLATEPLWIRLQHRRHEILADPNSQQLRGELIEDLKQIFLRLYTPQSWEELQGEERAQRRRALGMTGGAACLFLGLVVAAIGFGIGERRNARESKARELARYSTQSLSEDPDKSILLGMQALNATIRFGQPPVPAAEEALHQAILSSQVRMTLRGHSDFVHSVAFSPNGKRLATASEDHTVVFSCHAHESLASGLRNFLSRLHWNGLIGVRVLRSSVSDLSAFNELAEHPALYAHANTCSRRTFPSAECTFSINLGPSISKDRNP
jgi:hypothetical protein